MTFAGAPVGSRAPLSLILLPLERASTEHTGRNSRPLSSSAPSIGPSGIIKRTWRACHGEPEAVELAAFAARNILARILGQCPECFAVEGVFG